LYDHIVQKHVGDVIEVVLYRGQDTMTLMYGLVDNVSKSIIFTPQQTHQKLMEELSQHEAAAQHVTTDKAVAIQKVSQEQQSEKFVDAPIDKEDIDTDMSVLNFDESPWQDDVIKQKLVASSNQAISLQIEGSQVAMQGLNPQALNESDRHKKRLMQEREKLTPTLQGMKSKDTDMMRRSSRNVIFNGIQQ
jgi:hypothetical protein